MILFAKGVTSGYLPLGGVGRERAASPTRSSPRPAARCSATGATYSGHPAACAAALANLDILESDNLLERGRTMEQPLLETLQRCAEHRSPPRRAAAWGSWARSPSIPMPSPPTRRSETGGGRRPSARAHHPRGGDRDGLLAAAHHHPGASRPPRRPLLKALDEVHAALPAAARA
jgi:hypothetical protein